MTPSEQCVGDDERPESEEDLDVADESAVEPPIGLRHDAVEGEPGALAVGERWGLERRAIEQRAVELGVFHRGAPVTRYLDQLPVSVVQVGVGTGAMELARQRRRSPSTS